MKFTNIAIRFLLLILLLTASAVLHAQTTDTVSTTDVVFTPATEDTVKAEQPQANNEKVQTAAPVVKTNVSATLNADKAEPLKQSLWAIFLAGVLGGMAALLMPCIFPMLPLTVSYFTKSAQNKSSAVSKAIIYGIFIIVIYVVIGLIVTISFGADALNNLSTNGIFNFFFFLMLVLFAASFLGAFEITLPSSWVNEMDAKSDKGGLAGLFFMAATLALVSFSCTGPIIGTLLVQAATTGAVLGPAIGMLGFAIALAIPFAVFAMFPSLMQSLPRSGSWLNSVKVILGFLELALSLKFLSNVDLAYHWHWFDREIFLVLWIVISALAGLYLLGKLKFSHDSPLSYIAVPRLFLAIIVLSFTVYLIPGLWGAPLKSVSAFLPPMATQDFDLSAIGFSSAGNNITSQYDSKPHKYADLFDKPKGFNPFFDYDEGLAYAKKIHKPVMIDFTGHACVNCRKMEANVWPNKQVYQRINEDYVLIQLYVDDKTDLPEAEKFTSPQGRHIQTLGNKWSNLQATRFQSNSQPFYVLLDPATEAPMVTPQGADYNAESYLKFLDSGLNLFKSANK